MKSKRFLFLIVAFAFFGFFFAGANTALADGMLIPGPWPHPRPLPPEPAPMFSIKYHHVNVEINDQSVKTDIDQVFKNESGRRMEATYLFPIPETAAITDFSMYVGKEKVSGRVLDKDEARRIYEDIVRRRKDPALIEYVGRDLFSARVFPIEPHGEKRIRLSYQELAGARGDTYRYVYPLSTERFSSKSIESVSVHVTIKTSYPIKNIYSPSHDISVHRLSETEAEVGYEVSNERPDKDFELYYSVSRDDVGMTLLTYQEKSKDGYFLMLASPKVEYKDSDVRAKDILFIFDRTGSMSGEKIEQARNALKFCLNSLSSKDRFNLIAFNESPDPLFSGLVTADHDNVLRALELADRLDAQGGTNIDAALTTSFPMADDPARPTYVIFLTDGLPTVGTTDMSRIIENADRNAPPHLHLFVFGVGYDVNTHLLDKLSENHSGASEYVKPGEDIEVKVSNLFRMISSPVLTDIALDMGEMDAYDTAPIKLPDIFKGSQLVVTGRYRNATTTAVKLTGTAAGEKKTFALEQNVKESTRNTFIPTLWAGRRIGILLDEIRLHGEKKELIDEVVRLSKRYGIITEYTSFLVEEPGAAQMAEDKVYEMTLLSMDEAMNVQKGKWAVDQADAIRARKSAAAPMAMAKGYVDKSGVRQKITTMNNVRGNAFFLDGGTWVDNRYDSKKMKVIDIKPFSSAQFSVLERLPRLGAFFAQGDSVLIVVSDSLAIRTTSKGVEKLSKEEKKLLDDDAPNFYDALRPESSK